MKNVKKIMMVFLIFSVIFVNSIYASTNTQTRTENDLKIWDKFENNLTTTMKNAALKTPKVNEDEKIYDFANLLTDEEETLLLADIQNYIEEYDMDMVVVTIDDNNKNSAMDYADDFYDYNYFGIGDNRDGSLLLIDMDNRIVWISTTGEAISIYDDARIDKMLDYIAPNLTSKNYKGAVDNYIKYAGKYASEGIPSSNSNYHINELGEYVRNKSSFDLKEVLVSQLPITGVIVLIFLIIGIAGHRNVKKASRANYYLNKDSVKITSQKDIFLHSNTTKVKIETDSGGYGGGSSSHSSSSGSSHGGGGRGF